MRILSQDLHMFENFNYIHSSPNPLGFIPLVIDTDPDSPYDWHALDADPDPAK